MFYACACNVFREYHFRMTVHTIDYFPLRTTNKQGLLYKTRWLFDKSTALMLYKSLITPHYDFGAIIYEVAANYQLQRLQVIQNAAAHMILLADPRCPIYELHENLYLDTLATRRAKSLSRPLLHVYTMNSQTIYLTNCNE